MQHYETLQYFCMSSASTSSTPKSHGVQFTVGHDLESCCRPPLVIEAVPGKQSEAAGLPCMELAWEGGSSWLCCLGRLKLVRGICIATDSNRIALLIFSQVVPCSTLTPSSDMARTVVCSSYPGIMQQRSNSDMPFLYISPGRYAAQINARPSSRISSPSEALCPYVELQLQQSHLWQRSKLPPDKPPPTCDTKSKWFCVEI